VKLLIIILIAANIATFFWLRQTYPQSVSDRNGPLAQSGVASYTGDSLATIRLLDEPKVAASIAGSTVADDALNPQQLQPNPARTLDAEEAVDGQLAASASVIKNAKEKSEVSNTASVKHSVTKYATKNDVIQTAEQNIPVGSTNNAAQKPSLALLESAAEQTQKLPAGLCWFVDIEQDGKVAAKSNGLNEIGEYLGSLGIQSELVEVKIPKPLRYIVYLPAKDSNAEAMTELRRLLSDGYDAFVFRDGKYKNAISLGLYNNKRIAENMLSRFSSEGLDAKLSPWESFRYDSRLRLDGDSSGKLASGLWSALEDRWDGAQREKKYCNAIASR